MADNNARNINIISYIKACVISLIITLVLILVFALILKFTSVPNSAIAPINMMIKAISVAIGAIILTRNGERGMIRGAILGLIFSIVSFVVFSIMVGSFSINIGLVADIAFSAIVGAVVGIISVNRRNRTV